MRPHGSTIEALDELAEADMQYAELLRELDVLLRSTADVRQRAERLANLLDGAPAARERRAAELTKAEAEAREREQVLREAEAELAAASNNRDSERLAKAERSVIRGRDAVAMSERLVTIARGAVDEHDALVAAGVRAVPEVEAAAASLAASLRGRPRLAPDIGTAAPAGLREVVVWASGARAALTVARNGAITEREALIRQANELGSALLGEPLASASVALLRDRVERALPSATDH